MAKFDTILWDVDQTLLDFKKSEDYAVRYCFRKFGKEASDETVAIYSRINEGFWKRIEKGEINRKDALVQRFEQLFQQIGEQDMDAGAFQKEYAEALGSVYYYLDDSYELVKKLRGKYPYTDEKAAPFRFRPADRWYFRFGTNRNSKTS